MFQFHPEATTVLKFIFPFLLVICAYPTIAVQPHTTGERLPVGAGTVEPIPSTAFGRLADGQTVMNPRILGPTQELLPPYLATQSLRGEDYVEWCLRWNSLQEHLAEERSIPPRVVRGSAGSYQSFAESSTGGTRWRPGRSRHSFYSSSSSREEVWHIGGYGGGPVTVYNPFVSPSRRTGH